MHSKTDVQWTPQDKTKIFELGQIFAGVVVGAILGIAGMIYNQGREMSHLEEVVSHLPQPEVTAPAISKSMPGDAENSADLPVRPTVKPEKLDNIIRREQKKSVKESWGEAAYQSFTEQDLNSFEERHVPAQIAAELRQDDEFLDVVNAIRALPPTDRQKLLIACRTPLHPTWAELGEISRKGQTVSGQTAEILIADAIVDLVQNLVKLPADQFKKLYT
jgi:hypothetical protein